MQSELQGGEDMLTAQRDKIWYLQRINIFQDLTADEMEEVSALSLMRHYEENSRIFRQGDTASALFLLKEGNVRLSTTTQEGREIVLAVLGMGDIFGDLPLFGSETELCDAKALTPVELCIIPAADFERLISRRPAIALKLIRVMGQRLTEYQQKVESAYTKTAKQRLAELLLKLAEQHGMKTRLGLGITLRLTQQELANMVGATREMVAVLLGELRSEGVIHIAHHKVLVRDLKRLQEVAGRR